MRQLIGFWAGCLLIVSVAASSANAGQCNPKRCDLDGDGKQATKADFAAFQYALGAKKSQARFNEKADVDKSGVVTVSDWAILTEFCTFPK